MTIKTLVLSPTRIIWHLPGWLKPVILSVIFMIALTLVYLQVEAAYANRIYPGVKVAGIALGNKTLTEAEKILQEKITQIDMAGVGFNVADKVYNPTFSQLGFNFNVDALLTQAFQAGRAQHPVFALFQQHELNLSPRLDEKKFQSYFDEIAKPLLTEPQNATFKIASGKVELVPAKNGQGLDLPTIQTQVQKAIASPSQNLIVLQTTTLKPDVSDQEVSALQPEVEAILAQNIVLKTETDEYSPSADKIGSWLRLNKPSGQNLRIEFDEGKIKEYVGSLAAKIDIRVKNRQVLSTTGQVLDEGADGRALEQTEAVAKIKTALNSRGPATIALAVVPKTRGEDKIFPEDTAVPGRYEGRYIDIDLSEQVLSAFEGQNAIGSWSISTGKWSTPTPIGTRYIESKNDRAYSSKYNLYMPWWNSIGGGYGIHELPEWANGAKEGEGHLGTPVSHGCIRLGVGPAEFVYNWAPIGTPVFIHK